MFLILFLVSCFGGKWYGGISKKEKEYKEYKSCDIVGFIITSVNGKKIDVDEISLNIQDEKYKGQLVNGEYAFTNLSNGTYSIEVKKFGYEDYFGVIKIVNENNKIFYQGDLNIVLANKHINEKKISALGLKELNLFGDKSLTLKEKDGYFAFNRDHIGKYKVNLDGSVKDLEIYLLDNQIYVDVNNIAVEKFGSNILNVIIKCEPRLIEMINNKTIDLKFELEGDVKRYDIVNQNHTILNDKILLNFEMYMSEKAKIHPTLNLNIGKFSVKKELVIEHDGAFKNLEEDNFVIKELYFITKVICEKEKFSKLNFSLESKNKLYYIIENDELIIHSLGKVEDIKIVYDSFETVIFSCDLENYTSPLVGLKLEVETKSDFKSSYKRNLVIKKLEDSKFEHEIYLALAESGNYGIIEQINPDNPNVILPYTKPNNSVNILLIEKDDDVIIRQRLLKIEDYQVPKSDNRININNICIASKYNDKFRLNGMLFLNINHLIISEIFNKAKAGRSSVVDILLEVLHDDKPLPGANINLKFNKFGKCEFNFDPNFCLYEFGDSLALDLYRCDKNFSEIADKNRSISLNTQLYMVSQVDDVSLSSSVHLTDSSGEITNTKNVTAYKRYYELIYSKNDKVSPIFSSQTFNIKLSYGKSQDFLDETSFYKEYLRNSNGENKLILSSENAVAGKFGQNFNQYVYLEKAEKNDNSMVLGLTGLAGLFSENTFVQAVSLGAILFGTLGALVNTKSPEKTDLRNWQDNFIDSSGRPIEKISNSGQKDYAIEWEMYVKISEDSFSFPNSTLEGDAKIRVIRQIFDISGKQIYKKVESNFVPNSVDKTAVPNKEDWYLFRCKLDKVGNVTDKWGVNIPIPFQIYRHTFKKIDSISTSFVEH